MAWFDLYTLLVQDISGGIVIFTFLAILGITYFAILVGLNNRTMVTLLLVFFIMMSAFQQGLLIVAVLVIGVITTWFINRMLGARQ